MNTSLNNNRAQKIALELVNLVIQYCKRLRLSQYVDPDEILEVSRIVASNLVIASYLHSTLRAVCSNPNIGLQEISPRVTDNSEPIIRRFVRELIEIIDDLTAVSKLNELDVYEITECLEAIHAMTVYGDIYTAPAGVFVNGSTEQRKITGAFYTPSWVAKFICEGTIGHAIDTALEEAQKSGSLTKLADLFSRLNVIDPACGPGTFLIASFKTIMARYPQLLHTIEALRSLPPATTDSNINNTIKLFESREVFAQFLSKHLYGVDIDVAAAELASVCLSLVTSISRTNLKLPFFDTIKPGNSLVSEMPPLTIIRHGSEELIRHLVDIREQTRNCHENEERKTLYRQYRQRVQEIEQQTFVTWDGIRESAILPTDELQMAFCWELEYPEIFISDQTSQPTGFSFAVMNPPYDILKLNQSEFIHESQTKEERMDVCQKFSRLKIQEKYRARFFRQSGQYPYSAERVINLYRLMIERVLQITASDGIIGFIVPSTLLCDESASRLRRYILEQTRILGIDEFGERLGVFRSVTQAVCIMRIAKEQQSDVVPIVIHQSLPLMSPTNSYYLIPMALIKKISGSTLCIPRIPPKFWSIVEKIHQWPCLGSLNWILNRRGELDLTQYGSLIGFEATNTRLARGNHIGRYRLCLTRGKKAFYVDLNRFIEALGLSKKISHIQIERIAGQQVSNMSQRWRLKFAPVQSGTVLANSCNYLLVTNNTDDDHRHLMYLLALMNSILLNWRFKLTSTNNHVSNRELALLPIRIISPAESDKLVLMNKICDNVERLIRDDDESIQLENEAFIFYLYGLSIEETLAILLQEGATQYEVDTILYTLNRLQSTY